MKMKVSVAKLRAAITKHVAEDRKRYEREVAQFNKKMVTATDQYVVNIENYLKVVSSGGERLEGYELQRRLERGCGFPTKPKEPHEYKELLIKLDLAEDQILIVDDNSDYMKFLDGKCVCR